MRAKRLTCLGLAALFSTTSAAAFARGGGGHGGGGHAAGGGFHAAGRPNGLRMGGFATFNGGQVRTNGGQAVNNNPAGMNWGNHVSGAPRQLTFQNFGTEGKAQPTIPLGQFQAGGAAVAGSTSTAPHNGFVALPNNKAGDQQLGNFTNDGKLQILTVQRGVDGSSRVVGLPQAVQGAYAGDYANGRHTGLYGFGGGDGYGGTSIRGDRNGNYSYIQLTPQRGRQGYYQGNDGSSYRNIGNGWESWTGDSSSSWSRYGGNSLFGYSAGGSRCSSATSLSCAGGSDGGYGGGYGGYNSGGGGGGSTSISIGDLFGGLFGSSAQAAPAATAKLCAEYPGTYPVPDANGNPQCVPLPPRVIERQTNVVVEAAPRDLGPIITQHVDAP